MTKKQIDAIQWAVDTAAKWLVDNSTTDQDRRMGEAERAIEALKAEPQSDPWLDSRIRISDAIGALEMSEQFARMAGASMLVRNGIRRVRDEACQRRAFMNLPEQQPVATPDPAPESGLRKPHLQAIRELHKVAHDAWFGDETLAAAEKDSGNHGPDEIAAIEANLATVKEAIEIMEKEGLGFIS